MKRAEGLKPPADIREKGPERCCTACTKEEESPEFALTTRFLLREKASCVTINHSLKGFLDGGMKIDTAAKIRIGAF